MYLLQERLFRSLGEMNKPEGADANSYHNRNYLTASLSLTKLCRKREITIN